MRRTSRRISTLENRRRAVPEDDRGRVARALTWILILLLVTPVNAEKKSASKPAPAAVVVPSFPIAETGVFPIPYEKFGSFSGRGTDAFRYKITDRAGLSRAAGAGIYPNFGALAKDPHFKRWSAKKSTPASPWDNVESGDPQADFYVWATAKDVGPGARLLFTARALADGGHLRHALKAYHAVLVHFGKEPCWSADHTFVWYVGADALSQIESITTRHPEIGVRLTGARFRVKNGTDADTKNDEFEIDPGRWEKYTPKGAVPLESLSVKQQRGYGKVRLVQYENGHWQMLVDDKPFVVKGVTYNPTPVGQHVSSVGLRWMSDDSDENGRADAPYDTWLDVNLNHRQDADEKAVGDFAILKEMGANAIRIFRGGSGLAYDPTEFDKKVMRDMHETYGIYAIMGDFLGAYTVGSGATWDDGTDYTDPVQLENMRRSVRDYVMDHRNEPYVLMWLIGNENLMPADYSGVNATRTKAALQVEAYLGFVNEIAEMIHRLDPDHPVAVGNLDLLNVVEHGRFAPEVDIFGTNLYRGSHGFGSAWKEIRAGFDRPVMITEYGCDAWDTRRGEPNEDMQADYHAGNWSDIEIHRAGRRGVGNSIGGIVFQFVDEWWKSNNGPWETHDVEKDGAMAFPDGWSQEEWFGMLSLGDGSESPFLRQPRKVFYRYRDELWK